MALSDLEKLNHPDVQVAAEAFGRLSKDSRPVLYRYLSRISVPRAEREDFVQKTLLNVWNGRLRFKPEGETAWNIYLRKVAKNVVLDDARKQSRRPQLTFSEPEEVPVDELARIDEFILSVEERTRFYACADNLWLGESDGDANRQLLAIQLLHLGLSPEKVAKRVKVDSVDDFLLDPPTLRRFAFERLYYSNNRLAAYLLGVKIDELPNLWKAARCEDGTPPNGWTWPEVRVVNWRIGLGLRSEVIVPFDRCDYTADQLSEIVAQLIAKYPMAAEARYVCRMLPREAALEGDGLWKRLVFQYHCSDSLPQRQIHERTAEAAKVADYRLTETMIAGWISVGRLFTALEKYCKGKA